MSGSAPRWLLALAGGTALLGLVLKLSGVRGPAPGHPPAPAAHEAAKAPAAAAARRGAEDGGRLAAAPDTASDPARDAVPPPSDAELLAAEAPRMRTARAADGDDGASLHRVRNRRRAERNG